MTMSAMKAITSAPRLYASAEPSLLFIPVRAEESDEILLARSMRAVCTWLLSADRACCSEVRPLCRACSAAMMDDRVVERFVLGGEVGGVGGGGSAVNDAVVVYVRPL